MKRNEIKLLFILTTLLFIVVLPQPRHARLHDLNTQFYNEQPRAAFHPPPLYEEEKVFANENYRDTMMFDGQDVESLWAHLLKHLPESKLHKLHETVCLMRSISALEKEGFLFMNPEAVSWRKNYAIRELSFILGHSDPNNKQVASRIHVTEEMINKLALSDFFFHFKSQEKPAMRRDVFMEAEFAGRAQDPSVMNADLEQEKKNQKNTSEDHFIIQVQFPDAFLTYVSTKWNQVIMTGLILSSSILKLFIMPMVNSGKLAPEKLRSTVLYATIISVLVIRYVFHSHGEYHLSEMFGYISTLASLQLYSIASVPFPKTTEEREWRVWRRRSLDLMLHCCTYVWPCVAVLFHSHLVGYFSSFALAATLVSHDFQLVKSDLSSRLNRHTTTISDRLILYIYPQKANRSIVIRGKNAVAPRVLQSCFNMLVLYCTLVLVRKIGIPFLTVLERGVIFHCCLVYYTTILIVSSKWYIHKKAAMDALKRDPDQTAAEVDQTQVVHSSSTKSNPKIDVGEEVADPLIKQKMEDRLKKEYRHIYIRGNLVAVGSSTIFLLVAYLSNVDFVFTMTGYFFIAVLYLKYFEIFWRKENAIWAILGFIAILYGSYHMVKSLPPLYDPWRQLHTYSWAMLATTARL